MNNHHQVQGARWRHTFLGLLFLTALSLLLAVSLAGAAASRVGGGSRSIAQLHPQADQKGQEREEANRVSGPGPGGGTLLPAACVNGQQYSEVEPNSTITQAQFLESIYTTAITGSIVPTGDVDYFGFNAVAGDRIWGYVFTGESSFSDDSQLTLLDPMSNTIQFDEDNGSQGSLSSAIAGAYITQTGMTYLRVTRLSHAGMISPYKLYVNRTSSATVAETEANDTTGTADAYTLGSVITGTIPITTDVDTYSFPLNAGDRVVMHVDGDPERDNIQFNPNLRLLDISASPVITVDSDSSFCFTGCFSPPYRSENRVYQATSPGTYYVQVISDPSGPPTGSYNLHIFLEGTNCPTATPTSTSTKTATSTNTSTSTTTKTASATSTNTAAPTNTSPPAATATSTACPIQFQDVPSDYTFYPFVRCLACRNILGGYQCGGDNEPCGSSGDPYFRPSAQISRGQIAKIVSQSAGLDDPPGSRIFEDVPEDSPFFAFIQRLTNDGHMGGYPCGQRDTEPCVAGNRPYFRPSSNATRGQLSKIVASTAGIDDSPSGQTYEDVPADSPFYLWIEQLSALSVMSGYPCGGAGEPCGAGDKPYFRPNAPVTRGQASKIVSNTFFPNCETPARQ